MTHSKPTQVTEANTVDVTPTPTTQATNLTVVEPAALPAVDAPLSLEELAADAGAGRQNVTAADMATPIISILQANSPQCKKSDPNFISGASEGTFYNNVTRELYDGEQGITVLPCFFEKLYLEWKPKRGGLAGVHPVTTPLKDQVKMVKNEEGKEIPTLPNGNNLIETNQHYCILVRPDGGLEPVVIAMASSALKASKLWNTLMGQKTKERANGSKFTPATYAYLYKLTTKGVSKDNNSWSTWQIANAGEVTSRSVYEVARAFERAVSSGAVKVKQEQPNMSEPTKVTETDDEIPF